MEKKISKVRTTVDIIVVLVLLLGGAACFAAPSTGMMILGGTLILAGILVFLILKSGYRLEGEDGVFKKEEHFFPDARFDVIYSEISAGRMISSFKDEDKAIVVRLDLYRNKSNGKVFGNLFKYVPYDYVEKVPLIQLQ